MTADKMTNLLALVEEEESIVLTVAALARDGIILEVHLKSD